MRSVLLSWAPKRFALRRQPDLGEDVGLTDLLVRILVAGAGSGIASNMLSLHAAVAAGMFSANLVAEVQRSKNTQEPFSWHRALTIGFIAAAIPYGAISLVDSRS